MSGPIAETPASPAETPQIGEAWGDAISEERQRELEATLAAWEAETDHGERRGPFDRVGGSGRLFLTGADVFYLAARALVHAKPDFGQPLPNLTAARTALLGPIRRFPVNLDFSVLQLAGANLAGVSMKKARLHGAS